MNSIDILREQGPMTLRELAGATAKARGHKVRYADLEADDWRDDVYSATGPTDVSAT